jgi:hypothetical protein
MEPNPLCHVIALAIHGALAGGATPLMLGHAGFATLSINMDKLLK